MSSTTKKVVVGSATALVVSIVLVSSIAPLRARAIAVAVLADAVGVPFPRLFAPEVDKTTIEVGSVTGDLYSPSPDAPIILFVPGAAERGRADQRVIDAATALAEAERQVFVPELHLYDRTFDDEDIERIGGAAVALAEHSQEGSIGVVAFSYGGSFSLVAAREDAVAASMEFLAVFGAYYDLEHLVQGITTGVTILDGERIDFDTVPEAREVLVDSLIRLTPDAHDEELRTALSTGDATGLSPEVASVYELMTNDDPTRTDELVAALPETYRDFMTRFSPSEVIDQIEVPVYILQSRHDEATPWTEAEYLERNLPDSRLLFLEHFSHVDAPGLFELLLDAPDAWRFISWVLSAQE